MNFDLCCHIQMILLSTVQTAGGLMVCRIFSWHTLDPLAPVKLCLKTTANLMMVAHHVHPLWTHSTYLLISTSSRITHYVTIVSNYPFEQWLHCTQMAWTVTWSQSNRAPLDVMEREVHIMDVQQTTLHQLYDAVMPQTVKVVNLKLNLKGILNKVSN